MTRQEAEDYVFASYMRAQKYLSYDIPDSMKRHPGFTKEIIRSLFKGTPSVAVTGSKGKGSAAYILANLLSPYGRCGLMTGPHIESFNERFRVDSELISDSEFTDIVSGLKGLFDAIPCDTDKGEFISPIGIETSIAEVFFSRHQTRFDIYECGKGVKYDDVGNVPADYGIINSVFLEHTRELGGSLKEIAEDKACIIRPGMRSIYSAEQSEEVMDIIRAGAEENGVTLKCYGRDFEASDIRFLKSGMSCTVTTSNRVYRDIEISLMGSFQCCNLALAISAAEDITEGGFSSSDESRMRESLKKLDWFGRLSVIRREPFLLADCCINRSSLSGAFEVIDKLNIKNPLFILVIPDDKDYAGVAETIARCGYDIILSGVSSRHYRFSGARKERLLNSGIECGYNGDLADVLKNTGRPSVVLGTTAMLPELRKISGTPRL